MKRPDEPRAKIIGEEGGPQKPYPLRISGEVIKGFGRGSKKVSAISWRDGGIFLWLLFLAWVMYQFDRREVFANLVVMFKR